MHTPNPTPRPALPERLEYRPDKQSHGLIDGIICAGESSDFVAAISEITGTGSAAELIARYNAHSALVARAAEADRLREALEKIRRLLYHADSPAALNEARDLLYETAEGALNPAEVNRD